MSTDRIQPGGLQSRFDESTLNEEDAASVESDSSQGRSSASRQSQDVSLAAPRGGMSHETAASVSGDVPQEEGVASLLSGYKSGASAETLANLKRSQARRPLNLEQVAARVRAEARQEVLSTIDSLRVPQGPFSQAADQVWSATKDCQDAVECAAGIVSTATLLPLAVVEETGRAVLNVPANAAAFGAHVVGTFDAETGAARRGHAGAAVQNGLRTVQGVVAVASVASKAVLPTQAAALKGKEVAQAALEQGAFAAIHSDATGGEYARRIASGVVGGAAGKVASTACGDLCGGAVGQLTEDVLNGDQSNMSALAAAGLSNQTLGDAYRAFDNPFEGLGNQFLSSEMTRLSTPEESTID